MGKGPEQRLMRADEIPAFVDAMIEAGCDICAVGHESYVVGDVDLPPHQLDQVRPRLRAINEQFGDRDFLLFEIVAYLRSLGRYIDDTDIHHWSENRRTN